MNNLYYNKYINFLKENKLYNRELIKYLEKNTIRCKYNEKIQLGFFPVYKRDKLIKFYMISPEFNNDKCILINIRHYIEASILYSNLGYEYEINNEIENTSLYYENLYIKKSNNKRLKKYKKKLKK